MGVFQKGFHGVTQDARSGRVAAGNYFYSELLYRCLLKHRLACLCGLKDAISCSGSYMVLLQVFLPTSFTVMDRQP